MGQLTQTEYSNWLRDRRAASGAPISASGDYSSIGTSVLVIGLPGFKTFLSGYHISSDGPCQVDILDGSTVVARHFVDLGKQAIVGFDEEGDTIDPSERVNGGIPIMSEPGSAVVCGSSGDAIQVSRSTTANVSVYAVGRLISAEA